jgi:hypothetical protein
VRSELAAESCSILPPRHLDTTASSNGIRGQWVGLKSPTAAGDKPLLALLAAGEWLPL